MLKSEMQFRLVCGYVIIGLGLIDVTRPEQTSGQPSPSSPLKTWTGRWLPEHTSPSDLIEDNGPNIHDPKHGIKMGVSSDLCDDAKTNLTLDWYDSPDNYSCFNPTRLVPKWRTKALIEYENIPKFYSAHHSCMNESINYDEDIPTFGTHRPLWPKYGEYLFAPRQRWIHNLEHGAIVMLYHPCADSTLVAELRSLVTSCLYRHVITPYTLMHPDRPLALVAWGVRLTMSTVSAEVVRDFITRNALRGPEQVSRDGQYDHALLQHAQIITDTDDTTLCPEARP